MSKPKLAKNESLAFVVSIDTESGLCSDYWHVRARLCKVLDKASDDCPKGEIDWRFGYGGRCEALHDIRFESQGDVLEGARYPLYAYGIKFDVYKPDVDDVIEAAKLGQWIEKRLAKLNQDEGYAQGFAGYLLRVARVLGVKLVLMDGADSKWRYRASDLGYGLRVVQDEEAKAAANRAVREAQQTS